VSIRNVDDPAAGSATPSFIVSHRLGRDAGRDAYQHFDGRDDGWTKVMLKPGQRNGAHAH
jgi:glutathione-independent formaldehyde dehydrogenase